MGFCSVSSTNISLAATNYANDSQNFTTPYINNSTSSSSNGNASNSNQSNIDLFIIPQAFPLVDPGWESYNLTLIALMHDGKITIKDDYKKAYSEARDWNPLLVFETPDSDLKVGLINVKNVIVGQIKLYKSAEEMMRSVQYWKNIPFNEEVVLKLKKRGDNFIIAEMQFTNGDSALYGSQFYVDTSDSKKEAANKFNKDRPFDKKLIVKEYPIPTDLSSTADTLFWSASQNVLCKVIKTYGFYVCG